MPFLLDVHDLTVAYQKKPVLWNIDLEVDQPQLTAIIGPNGAGKSTLIKAILGLVPTLTGNVQVQGQPIDKARRRIAYVPQRTSVDWDFPINVMETVLMGTYGSLGWFRRPGSKQRDIARRALEDVSMTEFATRQIGQLSGGQQQRVFIARALAQQADIYFMDEPMAGVDAGTEAIIFNLLKKLREQGKTIFVVHHDLESISEQFDHVILLNKRLIAYGPTSTTFTAANLKRAYGGRLDLLDQLATSIQKKG